MWFAHEQQDTESEPPPCMLTKRWNSRRDCLASTTHKRLLGKSRCRSQVNAEGTSAFNAHELRVSLLAAVIQFLHSPSVLRMRQNTASAQPIPNNSFPFQSRRCPYPLLVKCPCGSNKDDKMRSLMIHVFLSCRNSKHGNPWRADSRAEMDGLHNETSPIRWR